MARSAEKAQAMLNRMITARKEAITGPVAKRPHLASEVTSTEECEKWRRQVHVTNTGTIYDIKILYIYIYKFLSNRVRTVDLYIN